MAKRQTFTAGSTNPQTDKTLNDNQLNVAWDPLQVLKAEILNGVLYQMSASSFDSSNEIANALTAFGVALDPNDNSQLAALLQQLRQTSLVFKGYVSTTEPSSATYDLLAGNMWINSNGMPTTFPVPATDIKIWNGTAWETTTDTYSPSPLDAFRNIDLNNGYYWFGGAWVIMSTDLSPDDFVLGADGLWRIKNSVNLRGAPTAETALAGTNTTQLATTAFVQNAVSSGTTGLGMPTGAILAFAGSTPPAGYLICDGSAISRTTYASLFAVIGTTYGAGDGNSTFNLPNLKNKTIRGDWSGASATNIGYSTLGQLPNIYGEIGNYWTTAASGAFYANSGALGSEKNEPHGIANTRFDASRCSSAYARSDNIVIPNSLTMHWVIKY